MSDTLTHLPIQSVQTLNERKKAIEIGLSAAVSNGVEAPSELVSELDAINKELEKRSR